MIGDSGIYAIVNKVNGKRYIGPAKSIRTRWRWHKNSLKAQRHDNSHLQRAWNAYGYDLFEFILLESVEAASVDDLREALTVREQHWIDLHSWYMLYNLSPSAGSTLGKRHSLKTISKIRAMKANVSEETRAKISAARKGTRASAETRAKLSAMRSGKSLSEKHRLALLGRTQSAETRAKIGAKQRGKTISVETRAKLRAARLGRKFPPLPEAVRAKISAANSGKKRTLEMRAAQSARLKGCTFAGRCPKMGRFDQLQLSI